MSSRLRAGIAGAVGAVVAFGLAELVHGLFERVPSIFVALAQAVIQLTPGEFVTRGIEALGTADIPVLVASLVIGTLLVAALLGILSVRRPYLALLIVGVLAVVAVAAAFAQPGVAPVATILTVIGALAAGCAVTSTLTSAAGFATGAERSAPEAAAAGSVNDPDSPVVRSREAHSERGTAVGRGGFLLLSGGAAAAGLAAVGVGRLLAGQNSPEAAAPKKLKLSDSAKQTSDSPSGKSEDGAKKAAVKHETLPPPDPEASLDVPGMPPLITPAKDFYLIDTVLQSPRIDVNTWKLSVKGAVDNPVEFSYKDLLGMSTREADVTLSCVSNEVGGGLVSNGRWTGVLLSDVLKEAGVSREKITRASRQLVGRSVDGWTSGFKTEIALDGREALVAFGLNGSELPAKHGYPVRLVVPGLYGYVSATKWITEIELTNWDFDAYWIQRTWTKDGPVKTQSRIDTVKDGDSLTAGTVQVGGVAWAPHRGISKVEVSADDGSSWNEARLAKQLDDDSWRQYVYDWDARPGDYTLQVRATDGDGVTQTGKLRPPHGGGGTDGATGYHTIQVSVA
ncbi:MAG TPA: molybdopterin-dependent oxidoreductase [Rubrobacteraceae bacterium]|nr:molybdopterin-dependent oxidoreductase [Rubrobacteraceae bacterium]